MKRWRDVSITHKLYVVIGTMAVLLGTELITLRFAMNTLSAVRAFVAGEGSWSKAQKNAAIALERYAITRDETDYARFLGFLTIPEGDHIARTELMKPNADLMVVRAGFIAGQIQPDDVDPMIRLLQHFSHVSYIARAIQVWTEGDELLVRFKEAGIEYHEIVRSPTPDPARAADALHRISRANEHLTNVEDEFSDVLGKGSRWLEGILIRLLMLAVLAVETVGLSLTLVTTRRLSHGLHAVRTTATQIGQGRFSAKVDIHSHDEIGDVGEKINEMGGLLERSYSDLEARVRARTTELTAMAAENARLYEEAASAVKMRDEFISIAAHELKTPLTAMLLRLDILSRATQRLAEQAPEREKLNEMVLGCVRQARRLNALSTYLLDLTRIRQGKLELSREVCDLGAIARDAVSELSTEDPHAGGLLRLQVDGAVVGNWDVSRLGQVVRNLITNAIKYGKGKPIDISITRDPNRPMARLAVRDDGDGISPEDQVRIFERFQRAGTNPQVSGLGLGLYVAKQIVEAHGGRITLKSAPGQGSTFTLELPLAAISPPAREPVAQKAPV